VSDDRVVEPLRITRCDGATRPCDHATVPDGHDEAGLVERVAAGDTDALRELYGRFGSILFGMALRVVGDRQAAEECTQDTFVAVWRGARTYDPARASVSTWLVSIARNRAVDLVRRRAARPADPYAEVERADESPDTAETVAAAETSSRVAAALGELPDAQREVIVLAYFHGLSHSEIAERLGLPLGTVKGRARLALDRLRGLAVTYALETERSG
jgi:RNA polymerase sigma-70 factor (ECF subfamily)